MEEIQRSSWYDKYPTIYHYKSFKKHPPPVVVCLGFRKTIQQVSVSTEVGLILDILAEIFLFQQGVHLQGQFTWAKLW